MINLSGWSRFVDLLRATGWQAFAVSAGCFLFLLLASTNSFELPSRWIVPIVTLVGIVSGTLAVMSIVRAICEWVYRGVPFVWKFVADTVAMRNSIATLNEQERIALLPHVRANSQTFYLNPFSRAGFPKRFGCRGSMPVWPIRGSSKSQPPIRKVGMPSFASPGAPGGC